jgi:hypothetical protein
MRQYAYAVLLFYRQAASLGGLRPSGLHSLKWLAVARAQASFLCFDCGAADLTAAPATTRREPKQRIQALLDIFVVHMQGSKHCDFRARLPLWRIMQAHWPFPFGQTGGPYGGEVAQLC